MMGCAVNSALAQWLEAGLGFFYPPICQICEGRRATGDEGFICPDCRQQVRFIHPPFCKRCGLPYEGEFTTPFECANCREMDLRFSSARSAVVAKGVVLEVIHRYKYERALWFEPFLAGLLACAAGPELRKKEWDMLVPVPLHPARKREREFNQAERLAERLSEAVHIPVGRGLLSRIESTRTQTLLTRQQRTLNVRRAFAARRCRELPGRRILLVDDVFTTGATASACAQALLAAGARDVGVWTVARGLGTGVQGS